MQTYWLCWPFQWGGGKVVDDLGSVRLYGLTNTICSN